MTPEERIEQQREIKCARNRKYWADHREEISQRRNVKIQCEACGRQVVKRHLDRHLTRRDHAKFSQDLSAQRVHEH